MARIARMGGSPSTLGFGSAVQGNIRDEHDWGWVNSNTVRHQPLRTSQQWRAVPWRAAAVQIGSWPDAKSDSFLLGRGQYHDASKSGEIVALVGIDHITVRREQVAGKTAVERASPQHP